MLMLQDNCLRPEMKPKFELQMIQNLMCAREVELISARENVFVLMLMMLI
jgi:hypothetical protein